MHPVTGVIKLKSTKVRTEKYVDRPSNSTQPTAVWTPEYHSAIQ